MALAGKPVVARGKVRYLRYLFLVFFSAVQGRRIRIGTSWQAEVGKGKVKK